LPLLELLIEDDATQFHFAYDAPSDRPAQAALPYIEQVPGRGWMGIYESAMEGFPGMVLVRTDPQTMTSHLPEKHYDPGVAYEGVTPWTSPWRMIAIAPDRERLAQSEMVRAIAR